METARQKRQCGAGDVLLFSPNVNYTEHPTGGTTVEYYSAGYDGVLVQRKPNAPDADDGGLSAFQADGGGLSAFQTDDGGLSALQTDFLFFESRANWKNSPRIFLPKAFSALSGGLPNGVVLAESYFQLFFADLLRESRLLPEQPSVKLSVLVTEAKNLIDAYFTTQLKMDELAKTLSVSYNFLELTFKKELHRTLSGYLMDKRLQESQTLLATTNLSVIQICLAVGFNNPAYFTKQFKTKYAQTTTSYRLSARL
jgi:AraC-like DNA-binding protein